MLALQDPPKVDYAGIIVNGPTTFRVDHTPYGGIRNSGFGREGVLDAIRDFSEKKLIVYPE